MGHTNQFASQVAEKVSATCSLSLISPWSGEKIEDGSQLLWLGAEEVEKLYPELVTYGADGKVEMVRYSMLTSMLFNELQKQRKENQRQAEQLKQLSVRIAAMKISTGRELRTMMERLSALEQAMQTRNAQEKMAAAPPLDR
jgi:hypothetical protein